MTQSDRCSGTLCRAPHCPRRDGTSNDIGGGMAAGDSYRVKALELLARADGESEQTSKAELENLAAAFLRLAEQAERNAALTIEFELPSDEKGNSKEPK